MTVRRVVAVLATALIGSACGADDGADVSTAAPEVEWEHQSLPVTIGADTQPTIGVDGDEIVVVITDDEGTLHGFGAGPDGQLVAAEPVAAGLGYPGITSVTRIGDEWLAMGSGSAQSDIADDLRFEVRAFTSPDGRSWVERPLTGFTEPTEPAAVASVGDGLVAVGTVRTGADPRDAGFEPGAWISADGSAWTEVDLPMDGVEGHVAGLAVAGERLIAVGSVDRRGVMWSSDDGGTSWAVSTPEEAADVHDFGSIVTDDDETVASGFGSGVSILRTTDGGATWQTSSAPPDTTEESFGPPVSAGGGRFYLLHYGRAEVPVEVCYADPRRCNGGGAVVPALYVSDDGDVWREVDTSATSDTRGFDAVTGTADGRLIGLLGVADATGAWILPAGAALPSVVRSPDPESDVDLLEPDEVPQVGTTYGVPVYTHCGIEWISLGEIPWRRSDVPADDEPYSMGGMLYGYATLTDPTHLDYTLDGEVIATYERVDGAQVPPCM